MGVGVIRCYEMTRPSTPVGLTSHRRRSWAKGNDGRGCNTASRDHATKVKPAIESLPQEAVTVR